MSSGAPTGFTSGARSTSVTVNRAMVMTAPSTTRAGHRVRLTRRARSPQVNRGVQAPASSRTSSAPKPSNSGPGKAAARYWPVMNMKMPTVMNRHGRAACGVMRRVSRIIVQAELAATVPRTSSSHCMPVPSGALKGTARARPSTASGTVQRTSGGMRLRRVMTASTAILPGGRPPWRNPWPVVRPRPPTRRPRLSASRGQQ